MKYLIISARPKQWIKNLIIFLPPLFYFEFSNSSFFIALKAFISFCLVSSGVYFFNDVKDIEKDKLHPLKKIRPIASGKIGFKPAMIASYSLFFISLLLASATSIKIFLIVFSYLIIQLLYCLKLKDLPIIDIISISFGFLLRAFAGGTINNAVSPWFILTIFFGALFLSVEKRKAELSFYKGVTLTRKVLKKYSLSFLNKIGNLASTTTLLSYSLWAAGPELNGAKSSLMLLTVPFVLYGVFRYQLISDINFSNNRKEFTSELPENIILSDKYTLINIAAWLIILIIILAIS